MKRRQLQYIWIKTIKDLLTEKVDVEAVESRAVPPAGQENSQNRSRRALNILRAPFQATMKGVQGGVSWAVSKAKQCSRWHINYSNYELVEIRKEDASKGTSELICQSSDIDMYHWAGHGDDDVYVGVCELLHVHYTVKQAGKNTAK